MGTGTATDATRRGQTPLADADVDAEAARIGRQSIAIVTWTTIGRITGFLRVLAISAVLGPTYLGNTFQAMNLMPNLAFELLTGSLFASLLVPRLVRSIDAGDRPTTARVAGGFLGVVVAGGLALTALALVAGSVLLTVFSAGVADREVAGAQQHVGGLLLLMLMPQVVLYGIAGTAGAVMNAHGRFALPAAAPVIENAGLIATMIAFALLFGTGRAVEDVGGAEILLLGLGPTGAVALRAAVLCVGARRCGTTLLPRRGWRDPEVREVLRLLRPSLAYAALSVLQWFAALAVANTVAGGVVAFTAAAALLALPVALGARPVALALLPRLARLHHANASERFGHEALRGFAVAFFVTVPAAVVCLLLCRHLAGAISFGEMAGDRGVTLLAASLAGGAVGMVAEAALAVGTNASYARLDARAPVGAMAIWTAVALAGMAGALLVDRDAGVLLALGAASSTGASAAAWYLTRRFTPLFPRGAGALAPSVRRALAGAVLTAATAYLVAEGLEPSVPVLPGMAIALAAAGAIYVVLQRRWRSPELAFFVEGLRRGRAA